jgi:hypothetical protein
MRYDPLQLAGMISKQLEPVQWLLNKPSRQLAAMADPMTDLMKAITGEEIKKAFDDLSRSFQVAHGWGDLFEQTGKAVLAFARDSERYRVTMLRLGWPPPLEIPVTLGRKLVKLWESEAATEQDISAVIVEFYGSEELERLLRRWRQRRWLSRRMPILDDAVRAHARGEYNLSIPALLPQLEGALGDAFRHVGRLSSRDLERYTDELVRSDGHPTGDSFLAAAREVYLNSILVPFHWGDPLPTLSRHAILHGADTEYGTAENSLRAILLFDYVQAAVRFIGTVGGRAYHRPGCLILARTQTDRVVFSSVSAARQRRRECSICGG